MGLTGSWNMNSPISLLKNPKETYIENFFPLFSYFMAKNLGTHLIENPLDGDTTVVQTVVAAVAWPPQVPRNS